VKAGFTGRAFATEPTMALMPIMLEDSVMILKNHADRCTVRPAYDAHDVEVAVRKLEPVRYHQVIDLAPGFSATCRCTGTARTAP
jgi:metallo-beta-lactamase family protein